MKKLYTSKTFSKMAGGRRYTPHSTPLDLPLAISYRNHQISLAYFSHFAPLIVLFVMKKQSLERTEGGVAQCPPYTLLTALHLFRDMIIIGKESTIVFRAIDKSVALF